MKNFKYLSILFICSVLCFNSCNDSDKKTKTEPVETVKATNTNTEKTPTANPKEPAQNAEGVWHYTCLIGCSGGAGSVTKCKTCGNMLSHNTAYHSKANNASSSAPFAEPTAATKAPEPAQNASGVWHYTCPQGHAGGAGSAIACTTCSTTLTHNSAYH